MIFASKYNFQTCSLYNLRHCINSFPSQFCLRRFTVSVAMIYPKEIATIHTRGSLLAICWNIKSSITFDIAARIRQLLSSPGLYFIIHITVILCFDTYSYFDGDELWYSTILYFQISDGNLSSNILITFGNNIARCRNFAI